jgi:hypothetical protein
MDIKEVQRLAELLAKETRGFQSYAGPAGWLGAHPRSGKYIADGIMRMRRIKQLTEQLETEMKKGI